MDPAALQRLYDALDARELEVAALEARMKKEEEEAKDKGTGSP